MRIKNAADGLAALGIASGASAPLLLAAAGERPALGAMALCLGLLAAAWEAS